MNILKTLFIFLLTAVLLCGCRQESKDIRTIDFSRTAETGDLTDLPGDDKVTLKVAVSAMLSPRETFSAYQELIRYIGDKLNVPVEFHQRRTYAEINEMIEKGQLDFAFICSGAFVQLDNDSGFEILAVPVTHGKTYYQAYVIVPSSSPAREFRDLKGMNFAYTDLLSNTGYLYPLYRIAMEKEDPGTFFSSTVFTNAHDVSIQMVARRVVDGAGVNSQVFDYLKETEPDRIRDVKVIEISENFGLPPVVASYRMDNELKMKVRKILINMHHDDRGRELITSLLIERFLEGNDGDYEGIRAMRYKLAD